ncbi:MAG: hypothetical protein V7754_23255, partial [Halioglobus sp.]
GALEPGDSKQGTTVQGRFNSPKDVDSYSVPLANNIAVNGSSEFSNQAFYIRVYDSRKRLLKSSDEAFSMNFPRGRYTVLISPCDEDGLCYQGVTSYTVSFQ